MAEGEYRRRVLELIRQLGDGPLAGAEIGAAVGKTAELLLSQLPRLTLYVVDAWRGDHDPAGSYWGTGDTMARLSTEESLAMMAECQRRLKPFGTRAIICCRISQAAATEHQDGVLDFVFIDAEHTASGVLADSRAWWPKLRPGGLCIWHDYRNPTYPGVESGVNQFLDETDVVLWSCNERLFIAEAWKP
jgi:predicted O-methyltransferase YrrM